MEKFVRVCEGLYSGVETRVGLWWKGGLDKDPLVPTPI